jgi:hypothetical protein
MMRISYWLVQLRLKKTQMVMMICCYGIKTSPKCQVKVEVKVEAKFIRLIGKKNTLFLAFSRSPLIIETSKRTKESFVLHGPRQKILKVTYPDHSNYARNAEE